MVAAKVNAGPQSHEIVSLQIERGCVVDIEKVCRHLPGQNFGDPARVAVMDGGVNDGRSGSGG